jgi:hypothetical protein
MIASHGGADTYPISTATPISGALLTDQYHWVAASVFAGVRIISSEVCDCSLDPEKQPLLGFLHRYGLRVFGFSNARSEKKGIANTVKNYTENHFLGIFGLIVLSATQRFMILGTGVRELHGISHLVRNDSCMP